LVDTHSIMHIQGIESPIFVPDTVLVRTCIWGLCWGLSCPSTGTYASTGALSHI